MPTAAALNPALIARRRPPVGHVATIVAATFDDHAYIAIAVGDLTENTGWTTHRIDRDDDDRIAGVIDALAWVDDYARTRQLDVAVNVTEDGMREWFAANAAAFERLRPLEGMRLETLARIQARATDCFTGLTNTPPPDPATLPTLVIGTDASGGRNRRGVGIALYTAEGHHKIGFLPDVEDIAVGELEAIIMAIKRFDDGRELHIESDSRKVVHWITEVTEPVALEHTRRVKWIRRALATRENITLSWVKGHADNPLNLVADRLAVTARRNAEAGITGEAAEEIIANILADSA